jgi:Spy/CpxP family protein refolding chaperone
MRTTKYFVMAGMTMCMAASLGVFYAADAAKPKYDIEEIMDKAHKPPKSSLLVQVKSGKATAEQKKQLLELYQELAKNKPEKGDPKDWQKRTNALVKAAQEVVDGKEGSTQALGKAANCGACHKAHKGD